MFSKLAGLTKNMITRVKNAVTAWMQYRKAVENIAGSLEDIEERANRERRMLEMKLEQQNGHFTSHYIMPFISLKFFVYLCTDLLP